MKILVIGSGGREHAIARAIRDSGYPEIQIYCAPGNVGIGRIAETVNINADDIDGLLDFAKAKNIDLTFVGPEGPLVKGIVDRFQKEGLNIFSPSMAAAQLEGSKIFAKRLMVEYDIPTAPFAIFDDAQRAKEYAGNIKYPVVIKADGLAAGKGVIICQNFREAHTAIYQIMVEKKFGDAGKRIIIEDCLIGEEASYMVLVDSNGNVVPLSSSQDHKRVFDNDEGENTGGMGAYSPALVVTPEIEEKILHKIIYPTVKAMEKKGIPFTGILYAGIMIVGSEPYTLEFNVRLGDPETQPVLARLETDFLYLIIMALRGRLNEVKMKWKYERAICVVMASKGYPGSYEKGHEIKGIEKAERAGAMVFHAGTEIKDGGQLVTSGGRVLGVTALGRDFREAQTNAYKAVDLIKCDNLFSRKDIGYRAIKEEVRREILFLEI